MTHTFSPGNTHTPLSIERQMYSSTAHPIHLHGYHFEVIATGYPVVNHTTAVYISPKLDTVARTRVCSGVFGYIRVYSGIFVVVEVFLPYMVYIYTIIIYYQGHVLFIYKCYNLLSHTNSCLIILYDIMIIRKYTFLNKYMYIYIINNYKLL